MQTWTDALFYIAFLGQIFVISYYFPEKILGRMRYVLETYPPSKYPKLYPKPHEDYERAHRTFKRVNRFIIALGFVVMLALLFVVDHSGFADDGYISEAWPMAYGVIQFVPLLLLELSEFKQLKLMRQANTATTRTAELRRRQVVDFVSPAIVALTLLFYFSAILIDLYVHDFVVSWDHDTTQRAIVLTATNLFFVALGAWMLYGRKQNPHQAPEDRVRHIGACLQSFFYASMVLSIFFMIQAVDDVYDLSFLDATLISLYLQIIAVVSIGHLLRSQPLEDMNFDVYRNTAEPIANGSVEQASMT